jgi:hypothetical protein
VSDRAVLRELVENSLRASSLDRDALRDAVRVVFDPHSEDRQAGPEPAPITTELFVRLAEARFTAIHKLDTFSDDDYETSRTIYVQTRAGYAKDQPDLAADPEYGRIFQAPEFERQLNSACVDLLTILGLSRLQPAQHRALAASFQLT